MNSQASKKLLIKNCESPLGLVLEGPIDENFDGAGFIKHLEALQQKTQKRVRIDLSGVVKVNSVGIERWFRTNHNSEIPILLMKVPLILIDQFNFWGRFFEINDVLVESFESPFFDPESEEVHSRFLVVGKDIPLLPNYEHYEAKCSLPNGKILEPDFDPEVYFFFLTFVWRRLGGAPPT